jgi:hypothetical protein
MLMARQSTSAKSPGLSPMTPRRVTDTRPFTEQLSIFLRLSVTCRPHDEYGQV